MSSFSSTSAYLQFAHRARSQRRFVHSSESRRFLREVLKSGARRVETLPTSCFLWRAREGGEKVEVPIPDSDYTYEEDRPHPADKMKPLPRGGAEGRANPSGITYLYLATHRDTAVAEVRPWKGGVVSVGQFRPIRDLKLVNTTLHSKQTLAPYSSKVRTPLEIEEWVWGDINRAFWEPTERGEDSSTYAPTQILSELFCDAGFDGVGYRSSYGEGHNIVLFDPNLASQVNCHIVRVMDIQFTLESDIQFGYDL